MSMTLINRYWYWHTIHANTLTKENQGAKKTGNREEDTDRSRSTIPRIDIIASIN